MRSQVTCWSHVCAPTLDPRSRGLCALRSAARYRLADISNPGFSKEERQTQIRAKFGFQCACALCALTGDELERSDARQYRIRQIDVATQTVTPAAPTVETSASYDRQSLADVVSGGRRGSISSSRRISVDDFSIVMRV